MTHCDQGADQRGAPVLHALHLGEKGCHVVVVALGVTELGRVKRGVDAGQAVKGVHAQASIIGHSRQTAALCRMPGLGQRVFYKGSVWLGRLGNTQLALADQFHTQWRKHGAQLGQFPRVIGGQNEFHARSLVLQHHQFTNAFFGQRQKHIHLVA